MKIWTNIGRERRDVRRAFAFGAMACRLGRVIASSTRQWRHFCTEAMVPTPTPSSSPELGTRKSACSGSDLDVSRSDGQDEFTPEMLEQIEEYKRKAAIFMKRRRGGLGAMRKFLDEAYDNYTWNETRYPGELFKIITGANKGLRLYKPTLEAIPSSIEWLKDPECERIFIKNREKWHKEGMFDILFEGDVFKLGIYIDDRCEGLAEAAVQDIHWAKERITGDRVRITKSDKSKC